MPDFAMWSPESWAALAAWVTVIVALAAGSFALQQVREARKLREEQSQPYVVAYMEPSGVSEAVIDLVVRNFGSTAAYEVTIEVRPHPKRTVQGGSPEDVLLFDRLPVLVPGQEWRTNWDFSPERARSDLPDDHDAVVIYSDARQQKLPPLRSTLSWGPYKQRRWVTTYGIHEVAKALREMKTIMTKWQEDIYGRGLAVYTRDGDAKDERQRKQLEDRQGGEEESGGPSPA